MSYSNMNTTKLSAQFYPGRPQLVSSSRLIGAVGSVNSSSSPFANNHHPPAAGRPKSKYHKTNPFSPVRRSKNGVRGRRPHLPLDSQSQSIFSPFHFGEGGRGVRFTVWGRVCLRRTPKIKMLIIAKRTHFPAFSA